MGKRSDFERVPRDFYPTPAEAVLPLLRHLSPGTKFCEPCAGDGRLVDHLTAAGHDCYYAFDIEPRRGDVHLGDACIELSAGYGVDCFITNPPWDRKILHPIIRNLSDRKPTWLLFDADWMHTRQAAPFMPLLRKVVSVGRVKWIPDSPFTGKDNCCWYLFDAHSDSPAMFVGREAAGSSSRASSTATRTPSTAGANASPMVIACRWRGLSSPIMGVSLDDA